MQIRLTFTALLKAVAHLHSKRVVHGDLKPLNIMRVGVSYRIIDFDAAVDLSVSRYCGAKYTSGYNTSFFVCVGMAAHTDRLTHRPPLLLRCRFVPPEMVRVTADGVAKLNALTSEPVDYAFVPADPSYDMWALGVMLYCLCTGGTLFVCDNNGDLIHQKDLLKLHHWADDDKQIRLSVVKDLYARNLISMLLTRDPAKRPTVLQAMSHPFVTGHKASRLGGDRGEFDVFLSYRVASDSVHVQKLYEALTAQGVTVWWDKMCLQPGEKWEEGFCEGLAKSDVFVPLLSRAAINHPTIPWQNFGKLTAESRCDNVFLEHRLALELRGTMHCTSLPLPPSFLPAYLVEHATTS